MAKKNPKRFHVKPQLYAYYFADLKAIAKRFGYNLVLHGSMRRDMDLIAIPWIDSPKDEMLMIQEFEKHLTGRYSEYKEHYLFSILPGGRKSYIINLNRGEHEEHYSDPMYYLDISVTPCVGKKEDTKPEELRLAVVIPAACETCRFFKSEIYHDMMWCRDCTQKNHFEQAAV